MAKVRRKQKNTYLFLLLKLIIFTIVTVCAIFKGLNRLSMEAMDEEFPTVRQKYAQVSAENGTLLTLKQIYQNKEDPANENGDKMIGNKRIPAKVPEIASVTLEGPVTEEEAEQPETELIEFYEPMFRGKLLKIKDPSRVYVGVAGPLGTPTSCGKQISKMVEEYGAMAAVNANGFVDPNGMGNGGLPVGIVISQGKLCYGDLYSFYEVTGFDDKGKLHCEWLTGQQALDLGIRDAACFGPILIKDGNKQDMTGRFGGYNPRTVIGQAEDGTVMILLIEGRMFTSIGLTYQQLVDYCYDLGMVNAGNMDGGASSVMYYEGVQNTIVSTLYGARDMPNCWLVAPEKQ